MQWYAGLPHKAFFKIFKDSIQSSLKENGTSYCRRLVRGFDILEKSLINLL
jgi:hypothetical protein